MAHNIPATIVAALAGVSVSMASGFLIASYVTSGAMADFDAVRHVASARPRDPVFIDDRWSPPAYDRMQIGLDQPGVRASGSSRL